MIRPVHGVIAACLVWVLAACGETTAPADSEGAAIRFSAVADPGDDLSAQTQEGSLLLTGRNGTLQIDELHVIVDRFELKRVDDDACAKGDDACRKFRAPPSLLSLPLDGTSVVAVRQPVDPGTYRRLKFKIEDLDQDHDYGKRHGDDDGRRRLFHDDDWEDRWPQIRDLRRDIRAAFPDWPDDASILVVGSFTPTEGEARPFRVYLEAEVDVEKRLIPPVTVGEEDATFTVELDVARFFRIGRGRLLNLANLDYDTTGRVLELEIDVNNDCVRVRFGH